MAGNDVTRILDAAAHGDPRAAEQLLPLVYDELRKLASQRLSREAPGQTLEGTALVHEAYLRLVDVEEAKQQRWNGRGHFFAAAAHRARISHGKGMTVAMATDQAKIEELFEAARSIAVTQITVFPETAAGCLNLPMA